LLTESNVIVPQPTEQHWHIVCKLLTDCQAKSNLVPDADLAALAIEHGATLHTTDRDFSRFEGLTWRNPLQIRAA
jgi:predicted nucleic acid-binding protein